MQRPVYCHFKLSRPAVRISFLIIHLQVDELDVGRCRTAMGVEFRIARHFACNSHEQRALHTVDLDSAVF